MEHFLQLKALTSKLKCFKLCSGQIESTSGQFLPVRPIFCNLFSVGRMVKILQMFDVDYNAE